ncbi:heavy metal translocating P-type ATPase [Jiella pelagia]|uniref:Heavy metal translocating P-type ATPase n=1 Tax=Jiella pelagia TaxID=2986949 RepID=A0ABY7C047_9HYPH|nr:heavy metal translocating P-type ATPase [Jiella pelagia]WAP68404.1 heavy metal translocating P-type ATPase [Jiella pelagia]
MRTSVIEVGDLLTASSPDEVGKRIGEVPGVESVSVDHAAESATVRYDETRIEVAEIKSLVQRSGRIVAAPPAASTGGDHEGHAAAEALPAKSEVASGHSGHGNHDKHAGHSPAMFRDRFWLSLALTVPVVIWSVHIQELLGYRAPTFPGSDWIGPVLSTVVFLYGGLVFLQGALRELRSRLPGMMTLISLAITVAFLFSWVVQLGLIEADALWWELATLVTIMLLGHWIEMRSINQAEGALKELAKLLPDTATRITDGGRRRLPSARCGTVTWCWFARARAFLRTAWCERGRATSTRR